MTWFALADGPWSAAWLSPAEKDELTREPCAAKNRASAKGPTGRGPRCCATPSPTSCGARASYGLSFFLPKVLVSAGASTLATGWWSALAFGAGALALFWASLQRGHRTLPLLFLAAAADFASAGLSHSLPTAVASFCLAAMGLLASLPIVLECAASRLSGKAAGAAIAIVNSVGAVGAFCGPYAMGWLRDADPQLFGGAVGHCCMPGGRIGVCHPARRSTRGLATGRMTIFLQKGNYPSGDLGRLGDVIVTSGRPLIGSSKRVSDELELRL